MRVIELKDVPIRSAKGSGVMLEDDQPFNEKTMVADHWHYRQNLINILRSPGKRNPDGSSAGMAYDEMQTSGTLKRELQKLEDGADWVLEEEDYNFVVAKVKSFPWPFQADVFEQFIEDIVKARSVGKDELRKALLGKNGQETTPVPIGSKRS